jgi:hypothetical protein
MDELIEEFEDWKRENKLTGKELGYIYDADDLLLVDGTGELPKPLTDEQRTWLRDFIERWDRQQKLVDHLAVLGAGMAAFL